MQNKTGAIMLVAGTCIGSGMIALPMVLAKIGLIPSIILMLIIWGLVYYTSIINLELHLQAGKDFSLGKLGRKFSGKIAEIIGLSSLKILSYALIAVYLYGSSSIIQKMLSSDNIIMITSIYAGIIALLLMLPIKFIDYLNRFLFLGLLAIVAILMTGLISTVNWNNLPLFGSEYHNISAWTILIPVVFTAFGFQGSLPSFINYCNRDITTLRKVFFWGCFIPTIVYIIWTIGILGVISNDSPEFYQKMLVGKIEVGDLVHELSQIAKWPLVQILIWWISLLAIITSVIGVGISLRDTIKSNFKINNILAAIATIFPAYLVAILVPNAFITVLGFAGMILVCIAILLPIYLLSKLPNKSYSCKELKPILVTLAFIMGCIIMGCEISNL